jgi:hypothetical protein
VGRRSATESIRGVQRTVRLSQQKVQRVGSRKRSTMLRRSQEAEAFAVKNRAVSGRIAGREPSTGVRNRWSSIEQRIAKVIR